jgi:hypothetical protein
MTPPPYVFSPLPELAAYNPYVVFQPKADIRQRNRPPDIKRFFPAAHGLNRRMPRQRNDARPERRGRPVRDGR